MNRILIVFFLALLASTVAADAPANHEFFEKKIRPVLVQHCYECHNSHNKKKGGLALDYKAALLAGGDSGKVIVPGKPEDSVLIWALRHEYGYEMPKSAPKLEDSVIADFENWVKLGAPDPRLKKPTPEELSKKLPWETVRDQRKRWWSFQPLQKSPPPEVSDQAWAGNPIDRFIYQRLQQEGLSPQPLASPEVLVRRLHLILTGLPPQPEVVQRFVANPSEAAYQDLVDRLLASKAFGERWARHWMDWYRYAESHGSEGDPRIPYVQQYRDYLIRALNADVPYNQLLREHLAGDLLENPRINAELQLNESAIGPAHLRMVPHGFGVTDAYGEQIAFTDNQIDVISKAMLGITVSCARCHNHKFDPISQKDFYRFYGIMVSCRPSTILIDTPEQLNTNREAIRDLKQEVRQAFTKHWLSEVNQLPAWLQQNAEQLKKYQNHTHPLGTWGLLQDAPAEAIPARINQFLKDVKRRRAANAEAIANAEFYVDLRDPKSGGKWYISGNSSASKVSPAGSFALQPQGELAIRGIYPRGIYTHLISDKHAGVFSSNNFKVRGRATFVRAAGEASQLRVPVRNYPRTHGLHPATELKNAQLAWLPAQRKWDYWQGEQVHYELATAKDKLSRPGNEDRSWFGVSEIFAGDRPPQDEGAPLVQLFKNPAAITDRDSLLSAYTQTLRAAILAWGDDRMSDQQAEFLNALVQAGFLTNRVDNLPAGLQELIKRYRELEREIPIPTRAPGVLDAEPVDHPLLVRGNPNQESESVERQFLEIFAERTYTDQNSGRLELAEDLLSERNTLKTRVLVNRLWAYVFGRGLVASTDNFGRLGSKPTHPELLDFLARDFERNGWSIKQALRQLVTSRTFRLSSQASSETLQRDEQNLYLSHYRPRRLDAETIYDSISFLAGREERAVYLPVIRNRLNPFLQTFNAPVPTSTVSSRTHTNVPAQSLAMMNGDLVETAARSWSDRIAHDDSLPTRQAKITAMFQQAYARSPSKPELETLLAFLGEGSENEAAIQNLVAQRKEFQQELDRLQAMRDTLLSPIVDRLQQEIDLRNAQNDTKPIDLKPLARWDFEEDARDAIGDLDGVLKGNAKIESEALILQGGCMLTAPLKKPLKAKTLEVLVQLDRLDQRGGGAMTVQTLNGSEFDSIVYAEARPQKWLAGSDHFRRTNPLDGPREEDAVEAPVHIVIVYDADGTIRAFRNGKPYDKPYRKSDLKIYPANQAQVAFGLRHGTGPARGRMLYGRIHQARLYDRALSAREIAAAANENLKEVVTREMVLMALSPAQREKLSQYEAQIQALSERVAEQARRIAELQANARVRNEYFGIAHALLNSKEFIYVY